MTKRKYQKRRKTKRRKHRKTKRRKHRKHRKTRKRHIAEIATRIRVDGETFKSALERAENIHIDAPPFEPEKWNSNKWRRNPHNCYTYAVNKIDPKLTAECERIKCEMKNHLKPQPGYYAGCPRINDKSKYACKLVMDRVFKDNPNFIKKDNMVCPKDYYSAALAVHPGLTYHFYRQDKDGYWSHKDGATDAKRYDASGNMILDPKKANRHYVGKKIDGQTVNYKDFCGYFCVPKDKNKKFWKSGPRQVGGAKSRYETINEPVQSWFANYPLE